MTTADLKRRLAVVSGMALDWLYPSVCAVCEEVQPQGRTLCAACDAELPRLRAPFCSRCGEHFEGRIDDDFTCPNCSKLKFAFEFARPAMMLDERTRTMIHQLKYGRGIHLAAGLGRLASGALEDDRFALALEEKWPLVPVPLHRSRQAWRHFNQAMEIAKPLGKIVGLPVLDGLKRVRATETQTHLTRKQRLENLRGVFAVSRGGERWPRKQGAILVDDVLTTGSTADACAKALRKAGYQRIFVVTVMRG